MTSTKTEIKKLANIVLQEIIDTDILPEIVKDDVVKQVQKELRRFSHQSQFNIRMILWKNRYDTIDKETFLKWFNSTHIRILTDLKGGS